MIGGNQVGIFVSAVQEHSPADQNGIRWVVIVEKTVEKLT